MITESTLNLIKETATDNIVDVVSDFVSLKKRGSIWVGLSPFNNERTPSFTVHPAKGIFKDFSSGKGGDIIEFLMSVQTWKFDEAIKYLGKRFGIDMDGNDFVFVPKPRIEPEIKQPSLIHPSVLIDTKANYLDNPLYNYLSDKINAYPIFDKYHVGVIKDWVIFWQVDVSGNIRSGKYIKYLSTGKRCKDTKATWEHSKTIEYVKVYDGFKLVQCFFGEHLITQDVRKPIAIVESEKTAIVASHFMPSYIWIACGSKMGLNDTKCAVLNNRSVTLFPDVGCYADWMEYAKKYNYNISDKIEKIATPEQKGLDIADFLL